METVLLTGAAGFIGSHLSERLLGLGYGVVGVDSLLTGRRSNLEKAISHPNFRMIEADVTKVFDFVNPFSAKFDWVMHFACPASPIDFESLAEEILEVDSKGTLNALQFAKRNGAKFFLASTSEVYGDPLVHPQKEDYWGNVSSIGPRSCYDEAKRFSEAAVMVYQRKYNLSTRIVRIFNTYGPRMRLNDGRVVPQLCSQALKGEALSVHGDGSQTRSFCFVTDLVDGIVKMMKVDEPLPINLGNPVEFSLNEFAKTVEKVANKKCGITYLPARPDDPRRRCPDISKAKRLLGWEPKVPLEEGLRVTLEAFRKEV
jgi:dTDP-glucose 4,6-dehydratase